MLLEKKFAIKEVTELRDGFGLISPDAATLYTGSSRKCSR
jgi:hypothetical protein